MNFRERIILTLANKCGHDFEPIMKTRLFTSSAPALERVALERFRDIYSYARFHVPYYRKKFDNIPASQVFNTLEDVKVIPYISKEEITRNCIISDERKPITTLESGGTTGKKVKTHLDGDYLLQRYGSLLRILYSLGWTMGEPIAALHPIEYAVFANAFKQIQNNEIGKLFFECVQQYGLYRLFHNRVNVYYDRGLFSDPSQVCLLSKIKHLRPRLLISRPDVLFTLIKQSLDSSKCLPKVSTILCVGNIFTGQLKMLIEGAFSGTCLNMYASTEMGYVGLSCTSSQEWVHIDEDNYLVELDPSGSGEIVITDFRNRAMPLIRYKTGDVGIIKEERCACGRQGRLLKIFGRVNRFIVNDDGVKVYESHVMDALSMLPGFFSLQIQRMQGDQISVRMRPVAVENKRNMDALELLGKALGIRRERFVIDDRNPFWISDSGKFSYIS